LLSDIFYILRFVVISLAKSKDFRLKSRSPRTKTFLNAAKSIENIFSKA